MVTMLQFYNQGTSVLLAWIMAESGVPRKMVDPRQIPPRGTFCRASTQEQPCKPYPPAILIHHSSQ